MTSPATPRGLAALLESVSASTFFRDHWDRRALHIRGRPGKFDGIYDVGAWRRGEGLGAVIAARIDAMGGQVEHPIEPAAIADCFAAGMTLCAEVTGDATLAPFLRAFTSDLKIAGGAGMAKLYASADDRGFAIHFDCFHVFVLQIEGRKRWRYGAVPAVPSPRWPGLVGDDGLPAYAFPHAAVPVIGSDGRPLPPPRVDGVDGVAGFATAVLDPGDCLYLPPGTWHVARAIGSSIAVSISPPRVTMLDLFTRGLDEVLQAQPEWRRDVFAGADPDPPGGRAPVSVAAAFAERIADLKGTLDRLDPRIFHRLWRRSVGVGPPSQAPGQAALAEPVDDRPIDQTDFLMHADGGLATYLVVPASDGRSEEILLHRGDDEWALPIETRGFVDGLVNHPEFRARAALGWDRGLAWDDIEPLLRQLLRGGFLRRRPGSR